MHSVIVCVLHCGLVLLLALSGCATTETPSAPQSTHVDRELVPVDASWRLQAKAALTTLAGRDTAGILWHRESMTRDRLVISGPVGLGARTLIREGDALWWLDNAHRIPVADLALEQQYLSLITSLPVSALALRLIGHEQGSTEGDGWVFDVASWQRLSGYTVPRKLRAENAQVSLDLVILSLTVESPQ